MRLTQRYDVAEEIINDTLWVVWRKAGEFRGESRGLDLDHGHRLPPALKALQRGRHRAAADGAGRRTNPSPASIELGAAKSSEWILRAMQQLPPEQRLALEFAYTYGHSCEEIALIMDCPINTVKTRMFHAREKLRRILPGLAGMGAQP